MNPLSRTPSFQTTLPDFSLLFVPQSIQWWDGHEEWFSAESSLCLILRMAFKLTDGFHQYTFCKTHFYQEGVTVKDELHQYTFCRTLFFYLEGVTQLAHAATSFQGFYSTSTYVTDLLGSFRLTTLCCVTCSLSLASSAKHHSS